MFYSISFSSSISFHFRQAGHHPQMLILVVYFWFRILRLF